MHAMAWGRVLNRCVHITHTYIGTVDTCLVFQWSMNFLKLLNIEILVSHPGMNQGIPSKGKITWSWSNSRSSVSGTSICNMVYTIARQYTYVHGCHPVWVPIDIPKIGNLPPTSWDIGTKVLFLLWSATCCWWCYPHTCRCWCKNCGQMVQGLWYVIISPALFILPLLSLFISFFSESTSFSTLLQTLFWVDSPV